MTIDQACERARQLRGKQFLMPQDRDALDSLMGAALVAQRLMARLETLESLTGALQDTNESSDGGESYMVMGNVDTALLIEVGLRRAK
jgi:hypothetical protein